MKKFSESFGRYKVWVGNKEPKGYPVYLRMSGYATTTVSYHKTVALANKAAKSKFRSLIK